MLKQFSKTVLWLFGWKIVGEIPAGIKKCVIIVAPHTSNLDFVIGRLAFYILDVNVKFLIKKEAFKFPVKKLLHSLGGIPVDRSKRNDLVDQVSSMFTSYDSLVVTITPEGTRRLNRRWKKGFYHIAVKSNVPIIFGFLDYKNKRGGVGPVFYPSGNYEKDLIEIESFYIDKGARRPEEFNLSPQNIKT
jgi:1-acyl-sn-glycerol-3-phosphate acyltransferase